MNRRTVVSLPPSSDFRSAPAFEKMCSGVFDIMLVFASIASRVTSEQIFRAANADKWNDSSAEDSTASQAR